MKIAESRYQNYVKMINNEDLKSHILSHQPFNSKEYIELAIILSMLVGIIQALLGFMKMGFITQLLSKPIISGFTSAAAILIGLNQLGPLLGIHLDKGNLTVLSKSVFHNII